MKARAGLKERTTAPTAKRKQAEEELRLRQERLEGLVGKGTAELKKANEQLRQEIAERKRAEEALLESEARYRLLAENTTDLIWTMDLSLRYTYMSPAITRMRGYTAEEIVGAPITETMTPTSVKVARKILAEQLAVEGMEGADPNRAAKLELEMYCKDGSTIWTEMNMTFLRDSDGRPAGILGVTRDISERKRAEETLRESEERFSQVAETAREWIWEVERHGHYTYSSPAVRDLLGYEPNEVIGKHWLGLIVPEERDQLVMGAKEVSASKEIFFRSIITKLRKDGHTVVVESTGRPILDAEGNVLGYRGADEDITERKRAEEELQQARAKLELRVKERTAELAAANEQLRQEIAERKQAGEALRESEERYRLLAENQSDVIWTLDLSLRYTYMSPSVQRMRGYTAEEIVGSTIQETMTPASVQLASKTLAEELVVERMEEKDLSRSRTLELEMYCRDGSTIWTEVKMTGIRDPDGHLVGVLGVTRDISDRKRAEEELKALNESLEQRVAKRTAEAEQRAEALARSNAKLEAEVAERKRAEESLRESEERYRSLVANIPDVVWTTDGEGNTSFISPNVEQTCGYTPQEICEGGDRVWFGRIHPDDIERVQKAYETLLAKGKKYDVEYRIKRKDGRWIWLHDRAIATREEAGRLHADGVFSDITERKQAEEDLKALNESLEQRADELTRSNRELEDFTYVVSHDLKEPLRGIEAFSGFLLEDYADKLDEQGQKYASVLRDSATRMNALIEDLLKLSRIGRTRGEFATVSVESLLQDVRRNLAFALEDKKVDLRIQPDLPTITCQPAHLKQVFDNLISNAIKFNDKPQPVVEIACHEDDGTCIFSVRDNGMGIDKRYHEKIFQIFQRLGHREDYEGTGAGLTICKKVVEGHGGRIWLESKVGQGSTFSFSISKNIRPTEETKEETNE